MLKSPCCPNNYIENFAFTMYAIETETQYQLEQLLEKIIQQNYADEDDYEKLLQYCDILNIEPSSIGIIDFL